MSQTDRHEQPTDIVPHLVLQSTQATTEQLAQIVETAATAPFATDLLDVDEPLWGSFWHGDVIAPGYRLPALELAHLRAIRLDKNWPEATDTAQYLAELRQTMRHPQTGIWTLAVAGEPCVVFGGPDKALATVVWYCATTGQLHAGYRALAVRLYPKQAFEQRKPEFKTSRSRTQPTPWLKHADLEITEPDQSLAARLDAEILRLRRRGSKQA
jgi:hypothetical protein